MTTRQLVAVLVFFLVFENGLSLDNGLALTPPMGFMTWQRFRCLTNCTLFPDECISEKLVKKTADAIVNLGYLKAGYEYLIIDDCWLEKNRTDNGYLKEDSERFPNGMKHLASYVHSKGLKFGIYENYGNLTCAGYPGLYGHEKKDLQMFADWEIDYIKVDGCYFYGDDYEKGYEKMRYILNATNRPIVYSCSYPAYDDEHSYPTNFEVLAENCNLWRNFEDIQDSWTSVTHILDYFALRQEYIAKFAGPGHWNDPDMLLVGNYGLSYDQSKVQMALWAILAAPLLISADLQNVRPEYQEILQNRDIIKINQDPLGLQGMRVFRNSSIEVWTRKVTPQTDGQYSYAVALYSRRTDGNPFLFRCTLKVIGLRSHTGYIFKDLYSGERLSGIYYPNSTLTARVNPTGVVFYKATIALST